MAGYSGFSKSNNAVEAELSGLFPASVLAKKIGVSTAAIKALLEVAEWHHTSSYYNKTYYYDIEDAMAIIDQLKAYKSEKAQEEDLGLCKINFIIWGGSRSHPKPNKITTETNATKKGDWYTFFYNGQKIRKNVKTNGFYIYQNQER